MSAIPVPQTNVKQAVPFFAVADMDSSLRFYRDGLGCTMKYQWIDEGKLRWCWLDIGNAAIMLQEFRKEGHDAWNPKGPVGEGVSICFQCEDAIALYHEFKSRGLQPKRPFVGNHFWVTGVTDPDGYKLFFESPTDTPEDTKYDG
jgi:catechol 2,3-dioxygenase-like lactoylglutathione lyase family enzyme